jgi:hypothetical protein
MPLALPQHHTHPKSTKWKLAELGTCLEGLLRVVEAAACHAVPDQVGPADVDLQALGIADDDHREARPREAHVDAPLVSDKADGLARGPAAGGGGAEMRVALAGRQPGNLPFSVH